MHSLGAQLLCGAVGLGAALACVIPLARATTRGERRRRVAEGPGAAAGELLVGVSFFAPGADRPTRAVLSVEQLGPAHVAVVLQPIDGGREASIVLPRAAAGAALPQLLAARAQGARHPVKGKPGWRGAAVEAGSVGTARRGQP